MTMTNLYSGRVSRTHHTVIQFAIAATVAIVVSLAGPVPALAQTSDANSPPSSASSQPQTSASIAGKKEQAGEPKVITKPSLFFPDLAHSGQPLTSGEKFNLGPESSPAGWPGGLVIGLAGLCRLLRQVVKRPAHALGEHLDVRAVVPVSDRGEVELAGVGHDRGAQGHVARDRQHRKHLKQRCPGKVQRGRR